VREVAAVDGDDCAGHEAGVGVQERQHHVQRRAEVLFGQCVDRSSGQHAGDGNQAIDTASSVNGGLREAAHVVWISRVPRYGEEVTAVADVPGELGPACSHRLAEREVIATRAPASSSAVAMPSPIPLVPPVTRTTRECQSGSIVRMLMCGVCAANIVAAGRRVRCMDRRD
jgi:hypothetical protein